MKRKIYTIMLAGALLCTACQSDTKVVSVNDEISNIEDEGIVDKKTIIEEDTIMVETIAETESEIQSLLPEQKRNEIDTFFNTGEFVYEPMLLEEVMLYLDEKGILYEAYYDDGDIRINMTLEDGTALIFLKTENIDGEYIGYALVMKGEYFISSVYQELYLKCYDVICDDYYFPRLSEQVMTEEEVYDLNLFDCRIAINELYAKHGRAFNDSFIRNIFELKTWYEPKYTAAEFDEIADNLLTEIEYKNLELILERQKNSRYGYNVLNKVKMLVSGSFIDIDGDGTKEKIEYVPAGVDEENYTASAILKMDKNQITYDGESIHENCYITSMDGIHKYIIIGEDGMSGDFKSTFYEYKNGELNIVGEMYSLPFEIEVYEDKIIAPEETQHFQCQPVKFRYELKNGSFEKQKDEYYDYRQNIAIANQDVSLYKSKEDKSVDVIIFAGEEVQVMGGDMENWVLLKKVSTGEEGWLEVKDYGTCVLPDGSEIYSGSLFEELYFYG